MTEGGWSSSDDAGGKSLPSASLVATYRKSGTRRKTAGPSLTLILLLEPDLSLVADFGSGVESPAVNPFGTDGTDADGSSAVVSSNSVPFDDTMGDGSASLGLIA